MAAGTQALRRSRAWEEEQQRVYRRRRVVGLVVAVLLLLLLVRGCSAVLGGGGGEEAASDAPAAPELPRGGRELLPRNRIVAYYGAPQDPELGVLGTAPLNVTARRLEARAREFSRPGRPALPAFELIATLAQSAPGDDGLHRLRQSDEVIARHLRAARAAKGLLILDIQPGQADFMDEVRALERWLVEPDVSLALDPEWHVPQGVQPGSVIGSTDAATVNEVADYLSRIVRARNLPQKVLIVHQFTDEMVTDRDMTRGSPGVALISNMDGFGTAPLKTGVYDRLSISQPATARLRRRSREPYNGFKLFFREDTGLMSARDVLALDPAPDVVVYE
jgi:hypothetical protein